MGATNPRDAAPGTIRGDLGIDLHREPGPRQRRPRVAPRARSASSSPNLLTPIGSASCSRLAVGRAASASRSLVQARHRSARRPPVAAGGTSRMSDNVRSDHGPRHGGRPRHRQHARLRARPAASCSTSRRSSPINVSDGRPLAVGLEAKRMIGRTPEPHPGHPAAEGRRHRRLRDLREDAPLLHPEGAPAPLVQAPHGHLRAVGHHRRRAAGRAGGRRVRRRPQARLHHRRADGRGHRRRPARCRSRPAT